MRARAGSSAAPLIGADVVARTPPVVEPPPNEPTPVRPSRPSNGASRQAGATDMRRIQAGDSSRMDPPLGALALDERHPPNSSRPRRLQGPAELESPLAPRVPRTPFFGHDAHVDRLNLADVCAPGRAAYRGAADRPRRAAKQAAASSRGLDSAAYSRARDAGSRTCAAPLRPRGRAATQPIPHGLLEIRRMFAPPQPPLETMGVAADGNRRMAKKPRRAGAVHRVALEAASCSVLTDRAERSNRGEASNRPEVVARPRRRWCARARHGARARHPTRRSHDSAGTTSRDTTADENGSRTTTGIAPFRRER